MTSTAAIDQGQPASCLFDAIVEKDYDGLVKLYAANARNSVGSYLSMKSRWAQQQENYSKSGTECNLDWLPLFLHTWKQKKSIFFVWFFEFLETFTCSLNTFVLMRHQTSSLHWLRNLHVLFRIISHTPHLCSSYQSYRGKTGRISTTAFIFRFWRRAKTKSPFCCAPRR